MNGNDWHLGCLRRLTRICLLGLVDYGPYHAGCRAHSAGKEPQRAPPFELVSGLLRGIYETVLAV
jgi:hypothetical protein